MMRRQPKKQKNGRGHKFSSLHMQAVFLHAAFIFSFRPGPFLPPGYLKHSRIGLGLAPGFPAVLPIRFCKQKQGDAVVTLFLRASRQPHSYCCFLAVSITSFGTDKLFNSLNLSYVPFIDWFIVTVFPSRFVVIFRSTTDAFCRNVFLSMV